MTEILISPKKNCKYYVVDFLDATAVGDEGGFAPNFQNNEEALTLCVEAIEKAGYTGKIKIGMDVAASEFHKDGKYDLDFKNEESKADDWISSDKLCDMYKVYFRFRSDSCLFTFTEFINLFCLLTGFY